MWLCHVAAGLPLLPLLPLLLRSGSVSLSGSSRLIFVLTFTLKLFFVLESTAVCHHHHVLFFLPGLYFFLGHTRFCYAGCLHMSVGVSRQLVVARGLKRRAADLSA